MDTLETLLEGRLADFNITGPRFVEVLQVMTVATMGDETAKEVLASINNYSSFLEFGEMMKFKYEEIYCEEIYKEKMDSSASSPASSTTFVRVLWDIENIPPHSSTSSKSAYEVVASILSHLKRTSIIPPSSTTDTNVTVFYSPEKKTLSPKDIKGLDRASVEQIFVSTKREDADRKLITRISREMNVLPKASSKFVIISSDMDFVPHMQLLSNGGFEVHSIADYEAGSEQAKVFEMFCNSCSMFEEVLKGVGGAGGEVVDHDEEALTTSIPSSSKSTSSSKTLRGVGYEINSTYTGACSFWSPAGWGFLLASHLSDSKKHHIFVHNTSLPDQNTKFRFLKKGEKVRFGVVESDGGVMAANCEAVDGLLACQQQQQQQQQQPKSHKHKRDKHF